MRKYVSTAPSIAATAASLSGFVLVLIQFDVCEELRLDLLQQAVSARTVQKPTSSSRRRRMSVTRGRRWSGRWSRCNWRPASASKERSSITTMGLSASFISCPFRAIGTLVKLASRWVWDVDFALRVEPVVRQKLERVPAAMVKPYDRWLSEDYFIFHVREAAGAPSAAELARDHGSEIAQVVRGDRTRLSEGECAEVLHSQVSYYAQDLAVIGWNAAFLYDTSAGAETAIQLLEYANSQLLEFRHYDELLTGDSR